MSTVKGIRIKNALLGASISGAELETLLTDPANLGPYIEQINLRGAARTLTQTPQAMDRVVASAISREEIERAPFIYDLILNGNMPVGKLVAQLVGLNPADYEDMDAVAASQTAMDAVVASQTAVDFVVTAPAGMSAIAASTLAMETVVDAPIALAAVVASQVARDAVLASTVAMDVIAASQDAMDAVVASEAFSDDLADSEVGMDAVAASQLAMYTIYSAPIAVAAVFGPQRYAIYAPHPDQITVTGQGVSEWADVSGNDISFTQTTNADRPPYTSTIGDYTVPRFDGSTDYLEGDAFGTLGANWAALTVVRRDLVVSGAAIVGDTNYDSIAFEGTANTAIFVNNTSDQTNVLIHADTTPGLVRWVASGGSGTINGVAASLAPDFDGTTTYMGYGYASGTNRYFDGDIAEIVFFENGFSTADVDRVERMLKIKYGLPL